jgi:hypothetical protein
MLDIDIASARASLTRLEELHTQLVALQSRIDALESALFG